MSVLNPVLYGNRLYGRETYSANADPVTTTLTMADSVSSADAYADTVNRLLADVMTVTEATLKSVNKPMADSMTLTDAITKSLSHALAETVTPTDAMTKSARKPMADSIAFTESFVTSFVKILSDTVTITETESDFVARVLTDSLSVQDGFVTVTITKVLNDILLLQDWLSLRLSKPNTWTVNVPKIASETLYGRVLFGRKLYSGQGGSSVTWNSQKPVQPNNGWKNFNELEEHS